MRIGIDNAFVAYCRLARAAILLVLLGLALVIGGFYFVGPVFVGAGGSLRGLMAYLGWSLAIWHPTLLFMAALWFLQRAAATLVQGGSELRLARHLALSGWLLMSGALAVVITRPLMLNSAQFARHLLEQNLQYQVWTTRLFDNYVAAAVIGLVGLLLVLVSRVLRRQAGAAEELRLIF
jgi:hypothetical protein